MLRAATMESARINSFLWRLGLKTTMTKSLVFRWWYEMYFTDFFHMIHIKQILNIFFFIYTFFLFFFIECCWHELRQRMKNMTAAEPDFVRPFLMRQMEDIGRIENCNSNVGYVKVPAWTSVVGNFHASPQKPEFRNLRLRHDVLEAANILNWSFRTNQDPSFQLSTFRNFVLWQHGRLGAGRRIPVPACVCVAVRRRFPEASGQYRGYYSANSDDSE